MRKNRRNRGKRRYLRGWWRVTDEKVMDFTGFVRVLGAMEFKGKGNSFFRKFLLKFRIFCMGVARQIGIIPIAERERILLTWKRI
jgi:hypothetical protein